MKILASATKGFTILEVLIAMAIFSIGILGITKMHTNSSFNNVKSRLYTQNASQAAGWIEQTINLDYDNDGDTTDKINSRYNITKTFTPQVLDANLADVKVVDSTKRIDIVIRKKNGELFSTTTSYKAITY